MSTMPRAAMLSMINDYQRDQKVAEVTDAFVGTPENFSIEQLNQYQDALEKGELKRFSRDILEDPEYRAKTGLPTIKFLDE
jgi:hypothetical protein